MSEGTPSLYDTARSRLAPDIRVAGMVPECGGPCCSGSFLRLLSGSSVFRFRLPEVLAGG